jgi:hypothetical protein
MELYQYSIFLIICGAIVGIPIVATIDDYKSDTLTPFYIFLMLFTIVVVMIFAPVMVNTARGKEVKGEASP